MTTNSHATPALIAPSRRAFLGATTKTVLSASAIAVLAGCSAMAKNAQMAGAGSGSDMKATEQDIAILNVALGLEHEAIGAYQLGAESGLLTKDVLPTAVLFQGQHKEHRDALARAVGKLGGKPVMAKPLDTYATALDAASLRNQTDVLMLAAKLEKAAVNAYLGVIPSFSNPEFSQVAGRLAADETMHWTALTAALGQALPKSALTFGA